MPLRKIREGKPLPDTEEMKAWRKQYMGMSFEEHKQRLMNLGLSEEEIEEFREAWMKEREKAKS